MRKGDKSGDPSGDPQSISVDTMTGVKYRTRSMMGRCQGGYCQMRIEQMIEQELGKKETEVQYEREGSNVLFGKVREV